QVGSAEEQPSRILWGVDSCKAFTGDPSGSELFSSISGSLGQPDFWGRYLTSTVCPGLSWPEIYLAAKAHMGILPIYNDYNCSSVSGYDTGMGYAQVVTAVAAHDGVPQGRVIAIDIEPPGEACPGAVPGRTGPAVPATWPPGSTRSEATPPTPTSTATRLSPTFPCGTHPDRRLKLANLPPGARVPLWPRAFPA